MTKTERSSIAANTKADQARRVLNNHGYTCINGCDGPDTAKASRLEFYSGVNGLVIMQVWNDDSITTLCEWGLGQTWDDFAKALQPLVVSQT
jgi:hypothetical protein